MWIINEYGDAADISKAVMLTFAEEEMDNKKFFVVTAKFGTVAEGAMRGDGYGDFYESEMILKNFTAPEDAKNYIAELVKDLNGKVSETDSAKLSYSFTWLTKLKTAANDAETEKILQDWLKEISEKKSAEVATE